MKTETPATPAHLSDAAKAFWERLRDDYSITDEQGLRLLTMAAENLDVGNRARAAIAEHGLTYQDRWGCPRARPEVAAMRNAHVVFCRIVRELGIELEDAK